MYLIVSCHLNLISSLFIHSPFHLFACLTSSAPFHFTSLSARKPQQCAKTLQNQREKKNMNVLQEFSTTLFMPACNLPVVIGTHLESEQLQGGPAELL